MFKLTDFLVEDFVKCQLVSLFQVFLHHTANAADMKGGRGGGEKKRIGLIFTVAIRSLRRIRREPTLEDYVSILPRLLSVIPAWVWASPRHLSPSSQSTGEAAVERERNMLPWEQVLMRMRLGRINQLARPTQAY